MAKLVSVAEMQAVERAADSSGLTYTKMMENAGSSLANYIVAHSHKFDKKIFALVGNGNNGGDSLVALEHLVRQGWKATAYLVKREPAEKYAKRAKKSKVELIISEKSDSSMLANQINKHAILLDGLLGTGVKLPLREPFSTVLAKVKEILAALVQPPFVVAVDCPSGMDTDTGEIPAEMLKANLTVCMAAVKRGMLRMPAFDHLGELVVADIGLEPDLPEWVKMNRYVIDEEIARSAVPPRPPGAHKGTFGTAFIVAGSHRFPGAALLAGEAAYRSGAGLVTIGTAESIQPSLAGHLREATWLPLPDASGWIAHSAAEIVRAGLDDRVTACLLGPGFGQQKTTQDFLNALLNPELPPLTIDADALKLLSRIDNWQQRLPTDTVLTPHPGEMAILSGLATDEIQNNRTEIAERFSKQWNVVLVLKGAFTVVAAPDGRSATLPLATPALARAGTGDVLAGLICGLRAQGVTAFEAACTAVWLHGQAGLRAAALMGGTAGVLAGDLIAEIPDLIGV